jgi:alginate O-acetyltransferase complex protein AlgI
VLFNSVQFGVFFAVVLFLMRLLGPRARRGWLLGSSLVFYGLWHPAYLLLLGADLAVNWWILGKLATSDRPRRWLAAAVVWTLGILSTFKYADFFLASVAPLTEGLWGFSPPLIEFVLPLGISFYSFQLLGLTIDVYRGTIAVPASFRRYALFIVFFPQLIAGPILRGAELLPQLETGGFNSRDRDRRGLWLLSSGLLKKVVLGDFFLAPFVNEVFGNRGFDPASFQLIAAYAFALQIYFDFSGYTDMARGMALLLGYELPLNFKEPYLSRDPSEFWNRWHITLSHWLRDYLYVPLGGNRHGKVRTQLNLFLTMLLGGLWHGAGWTYLAWGGGHGLLLVGHRLVTRVRRDPERPFALSDVWRVFAMFSAAALLFLVFRAPNLTIAWAMLKAMFGAWRGQPWPVLATLIVAVAFASHIVERWLRPRMPAVRARLGNGPFAGVVEGTMFGVAVGLAVAASGAGSAFIYFQF